MSKKNKPPKGDVYIPMEDFDPRNTKDVDPNIGKVATPKAP